MRVRIFGVDERENWISFYNFIIFRLSTQQIDGHADDEASFNADPYRTSRHVTSFVK